MESMLGEFTWEVSIAGYGVTTATDPTSGKTTSWIVRKDRDKPGGSRRYHPLRDHTGLFRTFADTDPKPAGLLSFANRFGRLSRTIISGLSITKPPLRPLTFGDVIDGEAVDDWRREIARFKALVSLWDRVAAKDIRGLSDYVSWNDATATVTTRPFGDWRRVAVGGFRRGDLIWPALAYLRTHVSQQLASATAPSIEFTPDGSKLRLIYQPQTLLGAMWLQFAHAMTGPKEFRRCRACARLYEVSRDKTTGRRADSIFCSHACKSRDQRTRKGTVRQLAKDGVSPREIERQTNTPIETVRKWLRGNPASGVRR
jgi:hypothetical protein